MPTPAVGVNPPIAKSFATQAARHPNRPGRHPADPFFIGPRPPIFRPHPDSRSHRPAPRSPTWYSGPGPRPVTCAGTDFSRPGKLTGFPPPRWKFRPSNLAGSLRPGKPAGFPALRRPTWSCTFQLANCLTRRTERPPHKGGLFYCLVKPFRAGTPAGFPPSRASNPAGSRLVRMFLVDTRGVCLIITSF